MSKILDLAKKHFPFEEPNPGQIEAIVEIVEKFLSGSKHVIVQAPTGIGKSAIASTLHRVLRELDSSNRTTIITATKGLQDQYGQADKLIFDLKGKTNYSCPYGKGPYNSGQRRTAQKQSICETRSIQNSEYSSNRWRRVFVDGFHDVAEVCTKLDLDRSAVLSHLFTINKENGLGYELSEDGKCARLIVPEGHVVFGPKVPRAKKGE